MTILTPQSVNVGKKIFILYKFLTIGVQYATREENSDLSIGVIWLQPPLFKPLYILSNLLKKCKIRSPLYAYLDLTKPARTQLGQNIIYGCNSNSPLCIHISSRLLATSSHHYTLDIY